MRPSLVSVVMIGIGAMYGICFMLVTMVGGIAIMVMGMRVGMLMGMRVRSAVCMGVLMVVHMGVLVLVRVQLTHSFRYSVSDNFMLPEVLENTSAEW